MINLDTQRRQKRERGRREVVKKQEIAKGSDQTERKENVGNAIGKEFQENKDKGQKG